MRVWIGCLACYNGGDLVGDWYDADGSASDVTAEELHQNAQWLDPSEDRSDHEELWVFDTDEAPHSSLAREMSPLEAAEIGSRLTDLEDNHIDPAAYAAFCDLFGHDFLDDVLSDFEESYNGEHQSREDFAQELADDLGCINPDAGWPNSYIDWERAARDLFMDYSDAPAPGGCIYVFRDI